MGVFRSLNGGNSWTPFQQGLPIVAVHGLAFVVDPTHSGAHKLRAGTYGRGTWEHDIPGPPIIYVDAGTTGSVQDGTFEHPFHTLGSGVAAAPPQAIVMTRSYTYAEPQTITKPLTLRTYVGPTVIR